MIITIPLKLPKQDETNETVVFGSDSWMIGTKVTEEDWCDNDDTISCPDFTDVTPSRPFLPTAVANKTCSACYATAANFKEFIKLDLKHKIQNLLKDVK